MFLGDGGDRGVAQRTPGGEACEGKRKMQLIIRVRRSSSGRARLRNNLCRSPRAVLPQRIKRIEPLRLPSRGCGVPACFSLRRFIRWGTPGTRLGTLLDHNILRSSARPRPCEIHSVVREPRPTKSSASPYQFTITVSVGVVANRCNELASTPRSLAIELSDWLSTMIQTLRALCQAAATSSFSR